MASPSGSAVMFGLYLLFYVFLCVFSFFFGTGVLGQVCCPPSKISSDRLFIVEAKHEDDDLDFFSSIPEAVSQAVAHMTSAKYVSHYLLFLCQSKYLPAFQNFASVYLMGSCGPFLS